MDPFLLWFTSNQGHLDDGAVGLRDFPESEGGRGAVALTDIPEGHVLFSIPRDLLLSTRTSSLKVLFGEAAWKSHRLHQGWAGLILCMLWEAAQGSDSKWAPYLASLPTTFGTPMFWKPDELDELRGTYVVDKLGKEDAERDYKEKVLPFIQERPDLFLPDSIGTNYSLEHYHIMGSRILSRSFNVETVDINAAETGTEEASDPPSMDVDQDEVTEREEDSDDDDDEENNVSDVSMVPMADLLNARYGSENAKLFYEQAELRMISTKAIKANEQIWNTYGDLPNAELLRRYGHVDLLPLPDGRIGNPGDVVEIRADVVVAAVQNSRPNLSSEAKQERISWWIEEGGDDVFVLELDLELPLDLVSMIRLLLLSNAEYEKAHSKGKPPKPIVDAEVLDVVDKVLQHRMSEYPTSIADDTGLLETALSTNVRHAIIVRQGEKVILEGVKTRIVQLRIELKGDSKNKRKREGDDRNPSQGKRR